MTEPDPTATAIKRDLDAVLASLRDSRRLLEAGHLLPDLAGLDDRIAAICRALAALEPAAAQGFLPMLGAVAEELAALEAACRQGRAQLPPEGGQAARNRAATAYHSPRSRT